MDAYLSGQLTVSIGSSTMCLDANGRGANGRGASPGTKVQVWPCNSGSNQQWRVNVNGTVTGAQSGLRLDVPGGSTANGVPVELWSSNGELNQRWAMQYWQLLMNKSGPARRGTCRLQPDTPARPPSGKPSATTHIVSPESPWPGIPETPTQ